MLLRWLLVGAFALHSLRRCVGTDILDECPTGWVSYELSCYKFVRSTPKNEHDALLACQGYNAQLVNINTMEEHSFIIGWLEKYDPQHKTWYTSGFDTGTNTWVWRGDNTLVSNLDLAFLPNQEYIVDYKFLAYNYSTYANQWGFLKVSGMTPFPYICEIAKDQLHLIIITERGMDYGIIVTDKEKIPRGPKIVKEPELSIFDTSTRSEKDYITLRCIADGYPPPDYEWYKEEFENNQLTLNKIDPIKDSRMTITDGLLIISKPRQNEDRGKYHCRAFNRFGTVISQSVQLGFAYISDFNLKRSSETGKENWGKAIYCDPPQHFPDIHYYWARDFYPNFVEEDKRTFVSQDGNLYFSALENIDAGRYSCNIQSVVSSIGKMGPFFSLEVLSHQSSQQLQLTNNFPKSFPEAPIAGQDVRLECVAYGYPVPSYNWTRKGYSKQLPAKATTTNHNRVLILPKVSVEDIGEYECTANNGRSSVSNSVSLSIQAKPVFTIPLEDMHMDSFSNLYWMCEAFGIPDVQYEWLKNGELLNDNTIPYEDKDRIRISNNVLEISNLNDRDPGMYQCKASNQLASTYSSGQLRVLTLKPSFAKHPLKAEIYAVEQSNLTVPCRPEGAPMPQFTWLKDGTRIASDGRRQILSNGYLSIKRVMRADEGRYTCIAQNNHGRDQSSGYLKIFAQPQFQEKPNQYRSVLINNTLHLRCRAYSDGGLDLSYVWYLNGLRLPSTSEGHFGLGRDFSELFVHNISFAEGGEYECIAKTPVSSSSAKTVVTVEGPPGPPGGVQILAKSHNYIIITWSDGANNGQRLETYTIEGKTQWNSSWTTIVRDITASNAANNRKQAELNQNLLSPWCRYSFRVLARNRIGFGEPSASSPEYRTEPDRPYTFPTEIGGGGGKIGDLTITWKPLSGQDQNAPGVWYKVFYKASDSNKDFKEVKGNIFCKDDDKCMFVISGIGKDNYYKLYKVKVQAFNEKGSGPISPEAEIYSAEDLPQAVPVEVSARAYNSTSLNVTWASINLARESIRGKLIGFRIRYWRRDQLKDQSVYYLSRSTNNWALIVGLQPFTFYRIVVSVFNDAGAGAESEYYEEKTYKAAPLKPPTSVVVTVTSHTSVHVTWRSVSPSQEEESLLGFKVRYWESDQDVSNYTDIFTPIGNNLDVSITGLKPGKVYILRVLAYSLGGDGRMSSPAFEFQMGGTPPGRYYASDAHHRSPSLLITGSVALFLSWIYFKKPCFFF